MQLQEQLNNKWKPVLDHPDLPEIKDSHRRAVTAGQTKWNVDRGRASY